MLKGRLALFTQHLQTSEGQIYLQPVGDFCQFGDGGLFVHKLLLIQVAKFGAVKSHPEVSPKHPLSNL